MISTHRLPESSRVPPFLLKAIHRDYDPRPMDGAVPDPEEVYELWDDLVKHTEDCVDRHHCKVCSWFHRWLDRQRIPARAEQAKDPTN